MDITVAISLTISSIEGRFAGLKLLTPKNEFLIKNCLKNFPANMQDNFKTKRKSKQTKKVEK